MPKIIIIISTSLEKKTAKAEAIGEETTLQRLNSPKSQNCNARKGRQLADERTIQRL